MSHGERIFIAERMIASNRSSIRTWLNIYYTMPGAQAVAMRAMREARDNMQSWQRYVARLRAEGDAA